MSWSFNDWTPDDAPGEVRTVTADRATWQPMIDFYTARHGSPQLERIFEIARGHGVRTVVVEKRYVDADWRSEHANFYGTTFRRYPSVCHRLHFFSAPVPENLDRLSDLQNDYRGYTVLRPIPFSPVGRTMIEPPAEVAGATHTSCRETVHLFGWPLNIVSMPFISQDAQYLRCAHASIWMVLRHATMEHDLPKRVPHDIQNACTDGVVIGRQIPSAGLSIHQMLAGMSRLGLAPGKIEVPNPASSPPLTLYGIICRYINSGLPPIVVSQSHAWVMVAWKRTPSAGNPTITLWRHDDAVGPYIRVDDPWNEPLAAHRPWSAIITPMLARMYIDAERAEATGYAWFELLRKSGSGTFPLSTAADASNELTYRTYAVRASDYKARLDHRGLDPSLAALFRLSHMPKHIWVVEAVDRGARSQGRPDVLGEFLLDATTSEYADLRDRGLVALHLEDFAFTAGPDHGEVQQLAVTQPSPYISDLYARVQ